ncbi:hypothetical protein [Vulgatibacter sp.]|uniref:hypothetical protein n=1 Tax=Vulgatibacter sp. TaxID=1971226 RepID=UPI003568610C
MRLPVSIAILVLAAACGGTPDEADSFESQQSALRGRRAVAAVSTGGIQFLPPLAAVQAPGGTFVADAPIEVRVDAVDASGAVTATVASWSTPDLLVDASDEFYRADWRTESGDAGHYRIVVSTPGGDVGAIALELTAGSPSGTAHSAGRTLPIKIRVEASALDRDGDTVVDWEDTCPDLANSDPGDLDCDGAIDPPPAPEGIRITTEGEAYGHHGDCGGWNACGDAATCAEWACYVNGYSALVSYGDARPCTEFTTCNLLDGPGSVQMGWGNFCEVMGVTDIDCAP